MKKVTSACFYSIINLNRSLLHHACQLFSAAQFALCTNASVDSQLRGLLQGILSNWDAHGLDILIQFKYLLQLCEVS
jgi:hypothetical protein